MSRHSITLAREVIGHISSTSLGTAALNAVSSISGVENAKIEHESDEQVELSYTWTGAEKFWETGEHLSKFGLRRVE